MVVAAVDVIVVVVLEVVVVVVVEVKLTKNTCRKHETDSKSTMYPN